MYELHAVIGPAPALRDLLTGSHTLIASLRQDLGMVLITDDLIADLLAGTPTDARAAVPPGPSVIRRVLPDWSEDVALAYVQASFHGGDGDQHAEVWRGGRCVWGPVAEVTFTGPRHQWPITAALHLIGAAPGGRADLFAEVGLGLERDMRDWATYAREGRSPRQYDARARIRAEQELDRMPADLDGRAVMAVLGIPAGPTVGVALRHLRQLRRDHGPMTRHQAETALRAWVEQRHSAP